VAAHQLNHRRTGPTKPHLSHAMMAGSQLRYKAKNRKRRR
jgi:hypothetical protein